MALIAALITVFVSGRITKPLKKLTEAAEQIAEGKLDVELPKPTNDEVGRLTRSFAVTVESLKQYIAGMKYKAYSDPLTHVKNKNALEETKERLQRQMRIGEAQYALLMLDVNNLKIINDTYGHDYGDEYLVNCCNTMCKVFEHSPVYRIGGDEFLVLLENADYDRREELIAEFNRIAEESLKEKNAWKHVSVAKGLAVCESSDGSPDDVLRRADLAMYEDKKRMKIVR
jgi:diguanylate cyclase (GGDEF)-like protein